VVVTFLSRDLLTLPLSDSLTLLFSFVFSLLLGNLDTSMDRLLYATLPGNLHNLLVLDRVALLLRDIFGDLLVLSVPLLPVLSVTVLPGDTLAALLGNLVAALSWFIHTLLTGLIPALLVTINITAFLFSDSLALLLIGSVALLPRFITALLAAENRSKTEKGGIQPDSLEIRHDSVRNVDERHKG